MSVSNLTCGKVTVTYIDGSQVAYDGVSNISLRRDWAFIRFADGARVQIPVGFIREIYEDGGVFVKGMRADPQ